MWSVQKKKAVCPYTDIQNIWLPTFVQYLFPYVRRGLSNKWPHFHNSCSILWWQYSPTVNLLLSITIMQKCITPGFVSARKSFSVRFCQCKLDNRDFWQHIIPWWYMEWFTEKRHLFCKCCYSGSKKCIRNCMLEVEGREYALYGFFSFINKSIQHLNPFPTLLLNM